MYRCEYCLGIGGKHDYRCPLTLEKKITHYCSICGKSIGYGEEYVENNDGEFAHYDCSSTRELVEFLGYEIKLMEKEE